MSVKRRRFVKGLGMTVGATFLVPTVSRLVAEAQGKHVPLSKYSINFLQDFGWGGGTSYNARHEYWRPTDDVISADTLPEAFAPLRPHADRMTLVTGLHTPRSIGAGVHGAPHFLTGQPKGRGPSWNHTVAKHLGRAMPYQSSSIGWATQHRPMTFNGSGSGEYIYTDPKQMVNHIFETHDAKTHLGRMGAGTTLAKSLLDSSHKNIQRVRRGLAVEERAKMDLFLHRLENLSKGLSRQLHSSPMCRRSPAFNETRETVLGLPAIESKMKTEIDIAITAMACGLLSTLNIQDDSGTMFSGHFGAVGTDQDYGSLHKTVFHHPKREKMAMINRLRYSAGLTDHAVRALQSVILPDGNNMFEHTVITKSTFGGTGHHNAHHDMPTLIIDGTGFFKRGYTRFDPDRSQSDPRRNNNRMFVTLCHALGFRRDSFAPGLRVEGGPIEELVR